MKVEYFVKCVCLKQADFIKIGFENGMPEATLSTSNLSLTSSAECSVESPNDTSSP